jgi:serine protease Do
MRLFLITCFVSLISISINAKLPTISPGGPLPENIFVELAKAVNPSVVFISTSRLPQGRQSRLPRDPMFDLFQQFMGPGLRQTPPQPMQALGTGFVIREDGLILTNNHVIDGADIIQVSFKDKPKTTYEAEVIGKDQRTDIALIKISDKKPFPVLKLGDSSKLQVGQWVSAFGNPYGHSYTMTVGIVSALGREIDELNKFPFIQTDAGINPGNSGGPLVNLKGEVIGVNSAIDARAQGIGFAIPINDVKSILEQLEKTGHVESGFLGIGMMRLDPRSARSLGLNNLEGVLVMQVEDGSAASNAGIETYDVIVKFNDKPVRSPNELAKMIMDSNVGEEIKLTYIRDGKEKSTKTKLGARPEEKVSKSSNPQQMKGSKAPFNLGFEIVGLSKDLIIRYGMPEELKGHPVVSNMDYNGPAAIGGLQPGDVILDINRKTVPSVKAAMKALKKGSNILRVSRNGMIILVVIEGN